MVRDNKNGAIPVDCANSEDGACAVSRQKPTPLFCSLMLIGDGQFIKKPISLARLILKLKYITG